jgi:hypothetical protein
MLSELLHRGPELFYPVPEYLTKALEYYTTTYVAPAYYIVAPKCYTTKAPVCYTTKAPVCYTTKAPVCYTNSCATSTYYTKYFSISVTTPRLKLTALPTLVKTTPNRPSNTPPQTNNRNWGGWVLRSPNHYIAASSYYVELKYYTETSVYYTTTNASSNY